MNPSDRTRRPAPQVKPYDGPWPTIAPPVAPPVVATVPAAPPVPQPSAFAQAHGDGAPKAQRESAQFNPADDRVTPPGTPTPAPAESREAREAREARAALEIRERENR